MRSGGKTERGSLKVEGEMKENRRNEDGKLLRRERVRGEAGRQTFGECHLPNLVTMLSQL